MTAYWKGYCPMDDKCKMKGRLMRWTYDKETVIARAANHLHMSSYHGMGWDAALGLAQTEEALVDGAGAGAARRHP